MVQIDPNAPSRFLAIGYGSDDWVAVLLKSHETGETAQRILPVSAVAASRFQAWLRFMNAARWSVYVSVNAVRPGRSRRKEAIAAVRHVVLDVDHEGPRILRELDARRDLPPLAYVLRTSPGRLHVFWRVSGFPPDLAEGLQRGLAQELGTDSAATSCAQMTRMPGFLNLKAPVARTSRIALISQGPRYVAVTHSGNDEARPWRPRASSLSPAASWLLDRATTVTTNRAQTRHPDRFDGPTEPALRHLTRIDPAIAGQHGDVQTFTVCGRVVRGFALSDEEALIALRENGRCVPPGASARCSTKSSGRVAIVKTRWPAQPASRLATSLTRLLWLTDKSHRAHAWSQEMLAVTPTELSSTPRGVRVRSAVAWRRHSRSLPTCGLISSKTKGASEWNDGSPG